MIHAREDYNRIQDPAVNHPAMLGDGSTPIAPDEPVMLFRAKDKFAPLIMEFYAGLLKGDPDAANAMAEAALAHAAKARLWQLRNGSKTPDMPRALASDPAVECDHWNSNGLDGKHCKDGVPYWIPKPAPEGESFRGMSIGQLQHLAMYAPQLSSGRMSLAELARRAAGNEQDKQDLADLIAMITHSTVTVTAQSIRVTDKFKAILARAEGLDKRG